MSKIIYSISQLLNRKTMRFNALEPMSSYIDNNVDANQIKTQSTSFFNFTSRGQNNNPLSIYLDYYLVDYHRKEKITQTILNY